LDYPWRVFGATVIFQFPIIGRWFFKRYNDAVSQYIFVMGMVFLAAFLAEAAGVEAIIGAFLAGLALNRLIPHTSALMNRVEFVGNALFIPFFLIGVGMLIDYRFLLKDLHTLLVGGSMIVVATSSKFMAAWLTQKTFGYNSDERKIIFGLSNAQAAATLAAVLVGYNIILGYDDMGNPQRLLDDSILNGTIMMILVTCTIATFSAQRGAQHIALQQEKEAEDEAIDENQSNILIPVNNENTTEELITLAVTLKSKKERSGLYALNIIDETNEQEDRERRARKLLDKAAVAAAATDNRIQTLFALRHQSGEWHQQCGEGA
jgi:Kef-type K+ transport system membrane component KefB